MTAISLYSSSRYKTFVQRTLHKGIDVLGQ